MAYKDILVYADAGKAAPACLDAATMLASAHKAHLTALHVVAPPFVPMDVTGGVPAQLLEWQEEVARQGAEFAEQEVRAAERRSGLKIEWRKVHGDVSATVLLHARYADLVVASQGGDDAEASVGIGDLVETTVMGAGRPALAVPRQGKVLTLGERVLVAWSRTREATRALHVALPILVRAKSVTVMEVNPRRGETPHIAGADVAAHLARHGVKVEVSSMAAGDMEVAEAILSRVTDLGADLVVMGAYGHSRVREFVFGGVTLHMLRNMTVPVLMSH
jgi:nucleotide-binding universal stress UspA family protein